jgi:hypothetical protein
VIYQASAGANEKRRFSQYFGSITTYWNRSSRPLNARFFQARFQSRRLQPQQLGRATLPAHAPAGELQHFDDVVPFHSRVKMTRQMSVRSSTTATVIAEVSAKYRRVRRMSAYIGSVEVVINRTPRTA